MRRRGAPPAARATAAGEALLRCPRSWPASTPATVSTQQAFGRFLMDLAHDAPEAAASLVTVSPDVASSTNLGGWINRAGVWNVGERIDWFADDSDTLVRWRESEHGQHIELGIAEGNLVGLLGELGATWSRDGQPLLPIGTLYDPFVNRALEQWSFGIYAGGQSILVGTPAGVTLAPEGGAHQSIITPSVGLEQPRCVAWEPAFGQDLEWMLLARAGAGSGEPTAHRPTCGSAPGRSTRRWRCCRRRADARERRRRQVLARRLPAARAGRARPSVTLAAIGVDRAGGARGRRRAGPAPGSPRTSLCLTSPDLLFRALQARGGLGEGDDAILAELFPASRRSPDRERARRPPPHARLPGQRAPARRRAASASRTSASPATCRTSTATSASTPTRSSAPRST